MRFMVFFPFYILPITVNLMATTEESNLFMEEENVGEILDINVTATLYDKHVPQLEVRWLDNLPNSTSYNVIVSAENTKLCPEMPCSVYGIPKLKTEEKLLIPENPMSIVDVLECSYMLGCTYKLTVETSNAAVARTTEVIIPYCISNVCSCQHSSTLPKVQMDATMPKNDTINLKWLIDWNNRNGRKYTNHEEEDTLEVIKMQKIYFMVNMQTNPSLSWGGKLIKVAESAYPVRNMSYIDSFKKLQGSVVIRTYREIPSNAMLNLHSHLQDDLYCNGPSNLVKIKVPNFTIPEKEFFENDFGNHQSAWIIGIAVFICVGASAFSIIIWRRKKQLEDLADIKKDDHSMSPFTEGIEMEENINYVDKYVEEAQSKGLADIFEIPHHAIQLETEIGEGAFGRVYRGVATNLRRMRGATVVAVKQLKRNPTADEVSEFLLEIEMLKGVGTHNNIVCFLGCCTIRPPYLMVMEYVGRGDLLTYLRTVRQYVSKVKPTDCTDSFDCKPKNPSVPVKYIELKTSTQSRSVQSLDSDMETERQPKPSLAETTYTIIEEETKFEYILDNKELHNFALQIANGMRFLEAQNVTHRDLAARNVLIDERKTLKISDFGLSRHGIYTNTKTRKLPLRWLSIEAIRDNVYSNKSDVWAYGVVLWEIGTLGASPYPTISNHELVPFLLLGQRLEKPEICTQLVYDIMLQCWNEDPEKRPTFEELFRLLRPKTTYVAINSLSDDYVFPPIDKKKDT